MAKYFFIEYNIVWRKYNAYVKTSDFEFLVEKAVFGVS